MLKPDDKVDKQHAIKMMQLADLIVKAPLAVKIKMRDYLKENFTHDEAAQEMVEHLDKLITLEKLVN